MGTLTSQLTTAVFRDTADERREPANNTEAWFSFSYRFEADETFVRQRKMELRRLVRERNKLIHTAAAEIKPEDAEKWIELIMLLNEQRNELAAEHEKLRIMIVDLAEMAKQSAQVIQSKLLRD